MVNNFFKAGALYRFSKAFCGVAWWLISGG